MDWLTGSKYGHAKKLISQLADDNKRDVAAQELIRLGAEAVPALIEAAQTQDPGLVQIYQHLLARIPSATPIMIKALSSAHPLIRGKIAEVFAINKDKNAVPALLDAIKGEFFTVRSRAAFALGEIGDQRVISELLLLLKDKELEVRVAACTALGKLRDPSTFDEIANVLLDDPHIEVRQSAAKALGDTKHPEAIPFLMEALRDSYWWYEKEQAAQILLNAIEGMGTVVIDSLLEALGDRETTVRKYAARVLGNLGDIRVIEELGMAVYDLHHEVSQTAADALAKFGSSAVDILGTALSHPEAAVREHAIMGLGQINDIRVAPLLIEMLNDPDRHVRKQAIHSLGRLNDERAVPALKQIASDRSDRELAALAKQVLG